MERATCCRPISCAGLRDLLTTKKIATLSYSGPVESVSFSGVAGAPVAAGDLASHCGAPSVMVADI